MRDLPQLLRAGDALVVNTTKVIPARLIGTRLRTDGEGAKIEITLIERLGPVDWRCFMKPAKKVKDGDIIDFGGVEAEVSEREEGAARLVSDCRRTRWKPANRAWHHAAAALYCRKTRA